MSFTLTLALLATTTHAWITTSTTTCRQGTTTTLQMGLFDGVKDAFAAPARTGIDAERETPIDRWMGWSVTSDGPSQQQQPQQQAPDFVDAMDKNSYVAVQLAKPMGIVFEENDVDYGGIFVQSLKDGSAAQGTLQQGDQLVAVNQQKVAGLPFDDALNAIVEANDPVKLVVFRGGAKQLYGPTGASKAWLDDFVNTGGVEVIKVESTTTTTKHTAE